MDWMIIINMLLDAIMESLAKRSAASIAGRLKRPRVRDWLLLRRLLVRKLGLRGSELQDACNECMTELKSLSESEVDDLVADAVAMRAERQNSE